MADASTTTYTSSLPPWHAEAWQDLYNNSKTVAATPYKAYEQPRVAGLNSDQLGAMDMVRGNTGSYQPGLNAAQANLNGALQTPNMAGIQQYMNPYADQVLGKTLDEMQRRDQIAGQGDAAAAAKVGAFGGDRYGLVQSERARNLSNSMDTTMLQANAANYQQAMDQFNKQQAIGIQGAGAMSNLAGATQQYAMNDASNVAGVGALLNQNTQKQLDLQFQDFQTQQQYPYNQQNFLKGILSGAPSGSSSNTSTQDPGSVTTAQGLGLGIGAVSAVAALKPWQWF